MLALVVELVELIGNFESGGLELENDVILEALWFGIDRFWLINWFELDNFVKDLMEDLYIGFRVE